MIKLFFVFYISLFCINLNAQSKKAEHWIGLYIPVYGEVSVRQLKEMDGNPAYYGDKFYSFGIIYTYSTCSCSGYEAGIEYSSYSVTVNPAPTGIYNPPYQAKVLLISMPLILRLNFFKYFFINGGIILDADISKHPLLSNQSGIGAVYGLGIKYEFKKGIGLYLNPYFKSHSWISFAPKDNNQRISEWGLRFGVAYRF